MAIYLLPPESIMLFEADDFNRHYVQRAVERLAAGHARCFTVYEERFGKRYCIYVGRPRSISRWKKKIMVLRAKKRRI